MRTGEDRPSLRNVIIFLVILVTAIASYDTWEVVTGNVDINKHLPFFFPGVLMLFVGLIWYLKRHEESLTPEQRDEFHRRIEEDSFTNPKHKHGDYS
ncbi:MAG: hypothetical protein AAB490_05400 [Patescibacteria group bacterium]